MKYPEGLEPPHRNDPEWEYSYKNSNSTKCVSASCMLFEDCCGKCKHFKPISIPVATLESCPLGYWEMNK